MVGSCGIRWDPIRDPMGSYDRGDGIRLHPMMEQAVSDGMMGLDGIDGNMRPNGIRR